MRGNAKLLALAIARGPAGAPRQLLRELFDAFEDIDAGLVELATLRREPAPTAPRRRSNSKNPGVALQRADMLADGRPRDTEFPRAVNKTSGFHYREKRPAACGTSLETWQW